VSESAGDRELRAAVQRAVNPPGEPAGVGASTSSAGPAGTGGRRRRPADPVRDEFDAIVAFLADIDVIATTDEDARVILSPGRRREAAMMRTIAGRALVSFAVAYLLTDPGGAAGFGRGPSRRPQVRPHITLTLRQQSLERDPRMVTCHRAPLVIRPMSHRVTIYSQGERQGNERQQ
jgi:hypothetical protein